MHSIALLLHPTLLQPMPLQPLALKAAARRLSGLVMSNPQTQTNPAKTLTELFALV